MGDPGVLVEELAGNCSLSGDDIGIIVGRDESEALLLREALRLGIGLVEAAAEEHGVAAEALNCVNLDVRGGLRHDDGGLDAELLSGKGAALGMVACGCCDDSLLLGLLWKLRDLVVGTAELEGVHRLQVLPLEEDGVVETLGKLLELLQRRYHRYIVNRRKQDLAQILCTGRLQF